MQRVPSAEGSYPTTSNSKAVASIMPAVQPPGKVLVSGANGFIAVWVVLLFLQKGYSVRGTVRSKAKGEYLSTLFAEYGDKFELSVVQDITNPGAFDEIVKGVDAIAHTASPFHFNADDPNELIGPAVNGTVGILESAIKNGTNVKRVIVLSSCASVSNISDRGELNEDNWNTSNPKEVEEKGREASQAAKYRASKTLAERAAWKFVEERKPSWDLVVLNPPFVFGPVLHEVPDPDSLNTSAKLFYDYVVKGTHTAEQLASVQMSWVDVRDLALAHVRAVEVEEAGGHRFILTSGSVVWQDWFDEAHNLIKSGKIPEGLIPPKAPAGTPGAGEKVKHQQWYSAAKAEKILGIQFKDRQTTAVDSILDYRGRGW